MKPLFRQPDAFILKAFQALPAALDAALPMKRRQEADLIYACRDLSALLTTGRQELSYWSSPRYCSAYLRYFLPWNLVRLCSLLPALDLGPVPDQPLILDLGSGPLTMPLALWMSRPDLRQRPLTILAQDASSHGLDLGREVFFHLSKELGQGEPWRIATLRGPLLTSLNQVRGRAWLITLANMLNELEEKPRNVQIRLEQLLPRLERLLAPEGNLLAVEPGTRQGGRIISRLRGLALNLTPVQDDFWQDEDGNDSRPAQVPDNPPAPRLHALSPCSHGRECPLSGSSGAAWCHMNTPEYAPPWLHQLSQGAGLDKDSVSLSFVHLSGRPASVEPGQLRVISDPFPLPGYPGRARYACGEQGLHLIVDSAFVPAGALTGAVPVKNAEGTPLRDAKSRAWLMALPGRAPKTDRAPTAQPAAGALKNALPDMPKASPKAAARPRPVKAKPRPKPFWEKGQK